LTRLADPGCALRQQQLQKHPRTRRADCARTLGKTAKEILDGVSELAKYVNDDSQIDPTKPDVWWASFFATGSPQYFEHLFHYAAQKLPEHDAGRMLVIAAT
jgi:hypothetical protein